MNNPNLDKRDELNKILIDKEVDSDVENKAMRRITDRMKSTPMRALSMTVKSIDEIFNSVRESVAYGLARGAVERGEEGRIGASETRLEEMDFIVKMEGDRIVRDPASSEGQRHRDLTRYLAGIARTERGSALINEAINRLVEMDSVRIKDRIRNGNNYVHEIVIGSGPHAQVYSAERLFMNPDEPCLCIESSPIIGGQFRYETTMHELNTKQGPESSIPEENVAGRSGNKNSLGRGIIQEPDIAYSTYGTQDRIATAVRINHALEARTVIKSELSSIRLNPSKDSAGKYIVEFIDTVSGEVFEVFTDRVVISTGLGKERLDFGDEVSRKIIAEEQAKFSSDGESGIMSLSQFHKQTVDRIRGGELPFKGMRHIAVIGAGDSGATVIEQVLGYAGNTGLTTRQDTNITIDWVGQSLTDESQYAVSSRHRYGQISADIPPSEIPNDEYFHRIRPIDGRAIAVRRSGDKFILTYGLYQKDNEGNNVLDENGRKIISSSQDVVVDHVVLATGFDNDFVDGMCSRTQNEIITTEDDIKSEMVRGLKIDGTVLHFSESSVYKTGKVVSTKIIEDILYVDLEMKSKNSSTKQIINIRLPASNDSLDLITEQLNIEEVQALEIPIKNNETEMVLDQTGEEVASRLIGTDIYKIGPLAIADTGKIPSWMEEAPGYISRSKRGEENIISKRVALWTSVPATRDFATIMSEEDSSLTIPKSLFGDEHGDEKTILPIPDVAGSADSTIITFSQKDIRKGIPIGSTKEDILKLIVAEIGESYIFPSQMKAINFIIHSPDSKNDTFQISTEEGLLNDNNYKFLLDRFITEPLMQSVLASFIRNTPSRTARITIPLLEGRPRIRNVRIEEI
jgi:hypothetical protein